MFVKLQIADSQRFIFINPNNVVFLEDNVSKGIETTLFLSGSNSFFTVMGSIDDVSEVINDAMKQ